MKTPTVTNYNGPHPNNTTTDIPDITDMTLRSALRTIRSCGRYAFGNIGELWAELSDGTELLVSLQKSGDCRLMSSQQIVRIDKQTGNIIRKYKWE